jgi:hypothetical protein
MEVFDPPVTIKFYFDNDKTKNFENVTRILFKTWMVLYLADGNQVIVNPGKVNFVETIRVNES